MKAADVLPLSMVLGEAKGKIVKRDGGWVLNSKHFSSGAWSKEPHILMWEDLTKMITYEVHLPSVRMKNMF